MKINWTLLLECNKKVSFLIEDWSLNKTSTREVTRSLAFSEFAGEFRNLVRSHGTTYGRRLARKALRYRKGTLVL